ncbi:MAG: hypothetical protein WDW36_001990 [Sanguina aurantia]
MAYPQQAQATFPQQGQTSHPQRAQATLPQQVSYAASMPSHPHFNSGPGPTGFAQALNFPLPTSANMGSSHTSATPLRAPFLPAKRKTPDVADLSASPQPAHPQATAAQASKAGLNRVPR